MSFFSKLFHSAPAVDYAELVSNGALIVDVRSAGEFAQGHIKGALNIPLDDIRNKVAELKGKNKVIITCCRSGARSGSARSILTDAGLECYNGGAWNELNSVLAG
jgi:rhodanese-related sulfurtransferase